MLARGQWKSCVTSAAIVMLLILHVTVTVNATNDEKNHKKRQIYREAVLPHAGGKIPDTAFETDRLFLNQLQKDGIAIPDGVIFEQRNPQVYPFLSKPMRPVYRVALSSDARYTPDVGKYHYQTVPTIDTTYLYPQIHGHKGLLTPSTPTYPVYKQLPLYSSQLNQVKFQPKKKAQLIDLTPNPGKGHTKHYKAESYQNFNILNTPIVPARPTKPLTQSQSPPSSPLPSGQYYLPNYGSSYLFNEFDDLFNKFDLPEGGDTSFYGKTIPLTHSAGDVAY